MKALLLVLAVGAVFLLLRGRLRGPALPPEAALDAFRAARGVIVDVREPSEWFGGVAEPAVLLPLSDLEGERRLWKPFLEGAKGKQVFLYCRSGSRSGRAAAILERDGFQAANIGGFSAWAGRGLPTRKPER